MKKSIALILALVMCLCLFSACGNGDTTAPADTSKPADTSTPAQPNTPDNSKDSEEYVAGSGGLMDPITFNVAYAEAEDTYIYKWMTWACDEITEYTGGDVSFAHFPSGALGTVTECIDTMLTGAELMATCGYDTIGVYDAGFVPYALPYMFESAEENLAFVETEFWDELCADVTDNTGIVILCSGYMGYRNFITTFPINSAADMKGRNIRMGSSESSQSFATVMGATPFTSNWADNYTNIQSGIYEGCEAPLSTIYASSLYEVGDYLTLTQHIINSFLLVVGEDQWNQIPEEYQNYITEKLHEACMNCYEDVIAGDAEYVQKFKDQGVTVIENPDISSFSAYVPALMESLNIDVAIYENFREVVDAAMAK